MPNSRRFSTAEVAKLAGVHRDTLLRWLRNGVVPEPGRDRRGWRSFSEAQTRAVAAYAHSTATGLGAIPSLAPERIQRLHQIEWDFAQAKTKYLTHGLHPYPAKYIPQIPNALIQELSVTGETIGDIFCGSGTTLVEALLLKRNAVGVDANPLAVLISQAKTTPLGPQQIAALVAVGDRAEDYGRSLAIYEEDSLFGRPVFRSSAPRPELSSIGQWFEPFVIEELAEIKSWCDEVSDSATRRAALVAFSSIIVAVSRQDSDTRYVRRDKGIRPGDSMRRFARAVRDAAAAIAELTDVCEERFSATILPASVLDQPKLPGLDLVVCSPPYPNAYSYHLYHRSRMLWLGMDQPAFKRAEIGSHRKYSARGARAANVDTFRNEMSVMFKWLATSLRRDRYACLVVGNSTIAGEKIDNAKLLEESAAPHGFVQEAAITRNLQDTRKAFNPAIGKIKTEKILILANRGGVLA